MKTGEKTINFTKVTQEDFTEEATFEKVWKDMEKGDLGRARRKWMSSGWGATRYSVQGGRGQRALSAHAAASGTPLFVTVIVMVSTA